MAFVEAIKGALGRGSGAGAKGAALKALVLPIFVVLMLAMMVLPLPAFGLDLLFTFNIALALMVVMVSAQMVRPLDFAALPSVLLVTTLLRLSLNVASTRVVLTEGHTGPAAAGRVIEAFGHFLIGGNFAVGLIVFAILVVINFVVVTKGAERIAEVGARFALDAMPGKQMAIDADLNAGLIDEKEARRRRAELVLHFAAEAVDEIAGVDLDVGPLQALALGDIGLQLFLGRRLQRMDGVGLNWRSPHSLGTERPPSR